MCVHRKPRRPCCPPEPPVSLWSWPLCRQDGASLQPPAPAQGQDGDACTAGQNRAQRGRGRRCEKVDSSQRAQEEAAIMEVQTRWLTAEVYRLITLEAGSPRSTGWQGGILPRLVSSAADGCLCLHMAFPLHLSVATFPLLIRMSAILG